MVLYHTVSVIASLIIAVHSFHDADNVLYDCWSLGAIAGDATIDCAGLGLAWPEAPPERVEVGQKFNLTYNAMATEMFFSNDSDIYPGKSTEQIRALCQNTTCPTDVSQATQENCCVWHANIHTCHPSVTNSHEICGPWVSNNGQLATHTGSQVGDIDTVFFAQDVFVDFVGLNFIIAHIRVGNIEVAIGQPLDVIARRECGDGLCTAEVGETCETCATDCCGITFPVGITAGVVAVCLLVPLVIVLIVIGVYYFQRRKFFYDESWIINIEEIRREGGIMSVISIRRSLDSFKKLQNLNQHHHLHHQHGGKEDLLEIRNSNNESHSASDIIGSMKSCKKQLFTTTGAYEGRTVAIKEMRRRDLVLSNAIRKEVLLIRILDHPNLCKFIGATIKDVANPCIISEYCPKGSLNDVLQNDDIPLNWGFRLSFVSDSAHGMAYLHSKKLYHGRLTSSNCTIDDRWVLKIADYGLPSFREPAAGGGSNKGSFEDFDVEALARIYQPPEIRGRKRPVVMPTTDIYSYSIILVEIATRMDPFSNFTHVNEDCKPTITRDHLTTSDTPCPCPDEYLDLINRCWAYVPSNRPTFDNIKRRVDRMKPTHASPVDHMMIMMEKYSKHLESLVAERTQELIAEQKKTAILLYNMLPRPIADDLKAGKPTPAKLFQSSTIYFSDIVGFTNLASSSTPFEIVKLLNELYSTFDDILDHFDVYKVETIGDAYMVVSGVPQENGDLHAGEIASMSLALLSACEKFKIPHRPDTKLEIRIGIHSGPVCAGVVGLKMPRYCLFGDTVNTASRMESNSEAMKVQCSETTYQLLKKLGNFHLECRGSIEIKGKGSMVTWWLVGKEYQPRDSLTGIKISRNEEEEEVEQDYAMNHSNKKRIYIAMEGSSTPPPPRHDASRQSWPAARRRGDGGNRKTYTTARRGSSCSANSCTSEDGSSRLRNIREERIVHVVTPPPPPPTKTMTYYSQLAPSPPTVQGLLPPSKSCGSVTLPGSVIDTHQNQHSS